MDNIINNIFGIFQDFNEPDGNITKDSSTKNIKINLFSCKLLHPFLFS